MLPTLFYANGFCSYANRAFPYAIAIAVKVRTMRATTAAKVAGAIAAAAAAEVGRCRRSCSRQEAFVVVAVAGSGSSNILFDKLVCLSADGLLQSPCNSFSDTGTSRSKALRTCPRTHGKRQDLLSFRFTNSSVRCPGGTSRRGPGQPQSHFFHMYRDPPPPRALREADG